MKIHHVIDIGLGVILAILAYLGLAYNAHWLPFTKINDNPPSGGSPSTTLAPAQTTIINTTQVILTQTWAATSTISASSPTATSATITQNENLGSLYIKGNSNQGIQITIPKTGNYRFEYLDGAYSAYPIGYANSDEHPWLTSIVVFPGDSVPWNGETMMTGEQLTSIADTNQIVYTQEEAIDLAKGQYTDTYLTQGQVFTLVAVDSQNAYYDNQGFVDLDWFFLGN
jgi:uncharacterized iron-regulated membrane protein